VLCLWNTKTLVNRLFVSTTNKDINAWYVVGNFLAPVWHCGSHSTAKHNH
jgi:hypothetical protein